MNVLVKVTEHVFNKIEQDDPEIAAFYKDNKIQLKLIAQKYAYFIGVQLGMQKQWKGQEIEECHQEVNNQC